MASRDDERWAVQSVSPASSNARAISVRERFAPADSRLSTLSYPRIGHFPFEIHRVQLKERNAVLLEVVEQLNAAAADQLSGL